MADSILKPPSALIALREVRERTIARLSDGFAHDLIDVDEFERRLTLAHTGSSVAALDALVSDLPAPTQALELSPNAQSLIPASAVQPQQRVLALLGNVGRAGAWACPRHLRVTTLLGNTQLDFREARLPAGTIDIELVTVLGNIELIVPPGLAVETSGNAILGDFAHVNRAPAEPDPTSPCLRIHGMTVLGTTRIEVRLPGESERDSRRRRRRERRQHRRALPAHDE